jgi:hypothetical protein
MVCDAVRARNVLLRQRVRQASDRQSVQRRLLDFEGRRFFVRITVCRSGVHTHLVNGRTPKQVHSSRFGAHHD